MIDTELAIKQLKSGLSLRMKKFALDLGLYGHYDYAKFMILGRSRVGSNFLRGLLNSHSRITAFGEIFRDYTSMDWDHMNYFQSQEMMKLVQDTPVDFLDSRLFGKYPRSIAAVGFKIFYYHAQNGRHAPVWPYLGEQPELKVIHLKRGNILKTHLSRKKAEITDNWVSTSNAKHNNRQAISLDYKECLKDFTRTRAWENEYDNFFANHAMLELLYEDLASNYAAEMKRIQEFLGVEFEVVEPATHKQSIQPLSEAISNFYELKEQFEGTPWEAFFVE